MEQLQAGSQAESPEMKVRTRTSEGFGARLASFRGARGLSQEELATAAGVSRRVIAYYEAESDQPPGALLVDLARALRVSTDELLGLMPSSERTPPKTARPRKRLQQVEALPAADQRTVLKLVEALAAARRQTRPRTKARVAS
jgi:transcriptional regulator with XRE-family HTH domain